MLEIQRKYIIKEENDTPIVKEVLKQYIKLRAKRKDMRKEINLRTKRVSIQTENSLGKWEDQWSIKKKYQVKKWEISRMKMWGWKEFSELQRSECENVSNVVINRLTGLEQKYIKILEKKPKKLK